MLVRKYTYNRTSIIQTNDKFVQKSQTIDLEKSNLRSCDKSKLQIKQFSNMNVCYVKEYISNNQWML